MAVTRYRLTNFCDFSSPIGCLHYVSYMTTDSSKYTTIVLDKRTYFSLRNLRHSDDKNFDAVINRLIKSAKGR